MRDMLMREIHYRLLAGSFGNTLRSLNTLGSQGHQITKAIAWLKEFYKEPLLVEDLANRSHMAPSTFHKYFKRITTLSPCSTRSSCVLVKPSALCCPKAMT